MEQQVDVVVLVEQLSKIISAQRATNEQLIKVNNQLNNQLNEVLSQMEKIKQQMKKADEEKSNKANKKV